MCDCYFPKCEKCEELIPVHIGDYRYPHIKVKVWCGKHLPIKRATIFKAVNPSKRDLEEGIYPGWKSAIRLCNGALEPELKDVGPNIESECKITVLK